MSPQLHAIIHGLKPYYDNAEETQKIIIRAGLVAAGADATASLIPGIALPATVIGCFGAVWVMYAHLCSTLGIKIKENTLKLLGRAVLSNIAANLGGALLGAVVGAFIPGVSVAASAIISFITVYIAGLIFLQMVLNMAQKSSDPYTFSDISEEEMKDFVSKQKINKEDVKAAKEAYKQNKDNK